MGRKADYSKNKKLGPGKKTKKQPAPEFDILKKEKDPSTFSSNQKKRAKKRAIRIEEKVEKSFKKQKIENEIPSKPPKSKQLLLASDSEGESEPEMPSDSDDDNLTFEQKAQKLIEEEEQRDLDNQLDLESKKDKVAVDIPSLQEVKTELEENADLDNLKAWIRDIAYVLSDLKTRSKGRSRSELIEIMRTCLCHYYSYNEWLLEKLMSLFNLSDFLDFLESNESTRPLTVRSNSLKVRRTDLFQNLLNQGVDVQTLNWTDVGLIIYKSNFSLGSTTEYFTGQYMIQSASSFLAVMALNPQPNELILDVCAAPGGKSTHIAATMKNTGMLCSNDIRKERTKALVGNLHRLGIKNAVITSLDGRLFGKKMPSRFDRALLDAPCTGTGVISKDPNVKCSKTDTDMHRSCVLQKELILSTIDAVKARSKTGGYIVYSTCSLLVEENEDVVNYALRNRKVKCVPTGLDIGEAGFVNYCGKSYHNSLKNSKRIYPHKHNMDGFFVALLKKYE